MRANWKYSCDNIEVFVECQAGVKELKHFQEQSQNQFIGSICLPKGTDVNSHNNLLFMLVHIDEKTGSDIRDK
jgi:hypothetical protein